MLTSKCRYVQNVINKNTIRYVVTNSAAVKEVEDVSATTKSWREIPGLSSLPLLGPVHHFLPGGTLYKKDNAAFMQKMASFGPISKLDSIFGSPTLIFLFDAESCATVLRGENWKPVRPGFLSLEYYRKKYKKNKVNRNTGLLTEHADDWKEFRTKVNQPMLHPKTIKLYSTVLDEVSQDMIARLKSLRGEDNTIKSKFDVEMNLWALESIGVVALGDRLNCFDPNLPENSPARKLIRVVHDIFVIAEQLDFKPSLWRYFSTPAFKKGMQIYEDQDNLTRYFVEKAAEKLRQKEKSDDEKGVLEKLLEINEQVAHTMASDMLFAGVDTTSNSMIYILHLMAMNPEKQEKLREELMTQQDRRPYLKACVKEAIRLLPVVSGNMRQSTKEYNVLGYKIPKDMFVIFNHHGMSISEEHYIRPKDYLPERWLVPKDDPLYHGNAHPFAHAPFGFGVRSCIGRRIAELEMETFLARLIQNFKIEWFGPPLKMNPTSINYAAPPFNFIFKDV